MIELLLIVIVVLFVLAFYLKFMRNTVFGISLRKGQYPGFFIFYDFIVFIAPSSILLNYFPVEVFWVAFKVKQEIVFSTSLVILVSYFLMLLILYFISRCLPMYFCFEKPSLKDKDIYIYRRFVFSSVFLSIFFVFVAWFFFGVGHSFMQSISLDQSISKARMELSDNAFAKFLKYYFIIVSPLLTAIIASPVFSGCRLSRFILLFGVVVMASWGGSKGPLLSLFIIYFVTLATFSDYRIRLRSFFVIFALLVFLIFLVYQVVLLQYPYLSDFSLFVDYFFQRMFIAQMIGVYEEFSLNIHDVLYFLHGVPFASFFVDVPVFHKDLMMITEDRLDPSSIGIKNTYFIAEAYAIGGWFFLFLSVIVYSVNFSLSYLIVLVFFNKFISDNFSFNKKIVSIFLFSYLGVTGGFSDIVLFKVIVMLFILMSPVFFMGYMSRFKFKL